MLNKRIIPVLLIEEKSLVKTIEFKKNYVGDPLMQLKFLMKNLLMN